MKLGFLAALIGLMLAGCSSNPFVIDDYVAKPAYDVTIVDERSALSKEGGKEKVLDPYFYHGDKMFTPAKLELFSGALADIFEIPPEKVVLHRFDVIDYYAKRLATAQAGAMASVSYSAAIGMAPAPEDTDFIACVIEASIDGHEVSSSATAEYEVSPFVSLVTNDPSYISAVHKAVKDSLQKWTELAAPPTE
jgi:hypothetical protein